MKTFIATIITVIFLFGCATPMVTSTEEYKCPVPPTLPVEKPVVKPAPVIPAPVTPVIPPVVEKKLEILPFYFDFDKSNVRNQEDTINRAVTVLKADKTKKAELQGNCDARGSDKYNYKLGLKRAETVKTILVKNGIDAKRIDTVSFGKKKATVPAKATDKERAKDRRVDIVLK